MSNSVSIGGGYSESSDVSEATYKQEVQDRLTALKSGLEKLIEARKKVGMRIWWAIEKRLKTKIEEGERLMMMPASEERGRMMTASSKGEGEREGRMVPGVGRKAEGVPGVRIKEKNARMMLGVRMKGEGVRMNVSTESTKEGVPGEERTTARKVPVLGMEEEGKSRNTLVAPVAGTMKSTKEGVPEEERTTAPKVTRVGMEVERNPHKYHSAPKAWITKSTKEGVPGEPCTTARKVPIVGMEEQGKDRNNALAPVAGTMKSTKEGVREEQRTTARKVPIVGMEEEGKPRKNLVAAVAGTTKTMEEVVPGDVRMKARKMHGVCMMGEGCDNSITGQGRNTGKGVRGEVRKNSLTGEVRMKGEGVPGEGEGEVRVKGEGVPGEGEGEVRMKAPEARMMAPYQEVRMKAPYQEILPTKEGPWTMSEERRMMMELAEELEDWLPRAKALETEVDELIKQASEEIEESRPGFTCSVNQKSSQELSEKMAEKLECVIALNKEATLILNVQRFVTEDHEDEELAIVDIQLPIFDQLWRRFEEKEMGIVGLYGIGGVGKTILLKQINKKLLDDKRNDTAIWVKVSKGLQLEEIQQLIWSKIGLGEETWKGRSLEERASEIYKNLSQKKFVLLMDDLWERVDLNKVGVPFPNPENGSKIVFTTRSLKICALMEADLQLKVECVACEEAWKIIRSNGGDEILDRVNPKHLWLVEDVVKRCHGLPLALNSVVQIVAHYKREPEPRRWALLFSFTDLNAILKRHVYHSLKSSYDNLQKDIFKTCLLYCILFPSEYSISKIDLIDQWIGEGFLDAKFGAQKQGYSIINALVDACLLEEDGGDCVKMHKIIHNMTSWIASEFEKEENFFARPDAGLTVAPRIEEYVKRMSVMGNKIAVLDSSPICHHLETLFINCIGLRTLYSCFFQHMHSLKVLNLSGNDSLRKLPSGISHLVSLQHLDLSSTGIVELPMELMTLKKLKCLNLESTNSLRTIPQQLISNINTLHVLRMFECGFFSGSSDGAEWLIEELPCLKNLNMLSITLNDFKALQKFLSSHSLQNCTQSLWLRSVQQPKSIKVALADLKHLKTLNISNCEMLEELKVDFEREEVLSIEERSFYFLNEVQIESCSKLRDLTWLVLAPNLKRLTVSDCSGMEAIIDMGRLSEFPEMMARNLIPFLKVTSLKLEKLPNLQSIYDSDLLLTDAKIDVDESLKPLLRIS